MQEAVSGEGARAKATPTSSARLGSVSNTTSTGQTLRPSKMAISPLSILPAERFA